MDGESSKLTRLSATAKDVNEDQPCVDNSQETKDSQSPANTVDFATTGAIQPVQQTLGFAPLRSTQPLGSGSYHTEDVPRDIPTGCTYTPNKDVPNRIPLQNDNSQMQGHLSSSQKLSQRHLAEFTNLGHSDRQTDSHALQDEDEVRHNFSTFPRMSSRTKTLTEKGLIYNTELNVKRFKSTVAAHRRKETKCFDLFKNEQTGISELLKARSDLEKCILAVSESFHRAVEISPDLYNEFISDLLTCEDRNRSLLFDLTKYIQSFENEHQSQASKQSKSLTGSSASKHHKSKSSKHSGSVVSSSHGGSQNSKSSIKAAAAANAAILRTKLKYLEAENEQKIKLDKLQMMRDLEIEEAKLDALHEIESNKSSKGSSISDGRNSASGNKGQGQVIHQQVRGDHISKSKCQNDQRDQSIHVGQNAEQVSSQFAARTVNNRVIEPQAHVAQQSSHGFSQLTATSNRGVEVVNPNTADLNCHAPVFIPSQTNDHCVRQEAIDTHCNVSPSTEHSTSTYSESNSSLQMSLLIQSINHLANINRLPTPVPEIFTGDPLEYPGWKAAFQALIGGREIAPLEKIHYLKTYLGGKAKQCVEGFLLSPTTESYDAAMALIEKRFGDCFTIANAFKSKIENWPKISPRDSQGLRKFSDFLRQCEVTSHTNPSLQVLNDDVQNRVMLSKLPDWLVSRWARHVYRCREELHLYPNFSNFVTFLAKESDIACDPVASLSFDKRSTSTQQPIKSFNTLAATKLKCVFCDKENHSIEFCFKFKDRTMEERKNFIKEKRLCFGCLRPGHNSQACRKRLKCSECSRQHPTPLHGDIKPKLNVNSTTMRPPSEKKMAESSKGNSHVSLFINDGTYSKSTMIVPVWISSSESQEELLVYALLDTQSDTSFVSKQTYSKLGISGTDTMLSLSTMTSERRVIPSKRVGKLVIRGYDSDVEIQLPTVYVHDNIPASRENIPTPEMTKHWPHLKSVSRHLLPKGNYDIGLLIGYNCPQALTPREVIPGEGNSPFAQRTDLGWGIIGLIQSEDVHVFSTQTGSHISLRTSAKEVIPCLASDKNSFLGNCYSQDDVKFLDLMTKGIHKSNDGHYQLPLPIRDINTMPQNNKVVAFQRLKGLVSRFKRDPQHYKFYTAFMTDLFVNHYAEEVPPCDSDKPAFYLPHHGVYNASKPGKVRVVMDASAKFKGTSLNDCLLPGPDLLNGLVGILCRFRQNRVAFMCDIKGMFQQFRVNQEDRDWLRFLWFKDSDYNSQPVEFRSTVHLFGLVSSPAVANFALKKAAAEHEVKYGRDVKLFIHHNFYMDDGLKSVETEEEAVSLIHRSKALCQENGLKLHKFVSNSRSVLSSLEEEDRADSLKTLDLSHDDLPVERALGVHWNIESDAFHFRVIISAKPNTRRGLLSSVSSIFDPLGFIAPVVLEGKQILQEACRLKLEWDDPLPPPLQTRWDKWLVELPAVKDVKILRCFKPPSFGQIVISELHYFSDASMSGYGQCTYLRLVDEYQQVHCCLVMAKARVTPLRTITIPRLELAAAVLSTEVCQLLKEELELDLTHHFWTDSQITLGFIAADSKRFQVYVANRIQQIRDVSEADQWHHVATNDNPADMASRGCNGSKLINSSWFTGPSFLWKSDLQLEAESFELEIPVSELKKTTCLASVSNPTVDQVFSFKFRSWKHARRVIGICICFLDNLKSKVRRKMSVNDLQKAEKCLVKLVQSECFQEEISNLQTQHQVKLSSNLASLDPFIDEEGVLRVGGRIKQNELLPLEIRHPILMPKNHLLSQLLVRHCHEESQHQGKGMLVSTVRSLGYWVVGLTSLVSSMIFKCVTCRKLRGSFQGQKMANLPDERLKAGPPFTYVGLDYFGPFYIAQGRKEVKRYGVLFTCLTSRAVHLETANSLDSDSFINALRRFLSIRGHVRTIRCDRGTNLMGGIAQLQDAETKIQEDQVRSFLLENSCDFIVNVPNASHQGGVWERQIRTVRSVLNAMLSSQGKQLDDEGLRTFMHEAANIVNSRPLTVESLADPTSLQPLTPNHLLTMKTNVVVPPPGKFLEVDVYSRKRWRRVQYLSNMFWDRWRKEYLTHIQSRQKWVRKQRNIQIDDIVLIADEGLPRCQWKLGRIVEVYPCQDGLVRKVKIVVGDPGLAKNGKRTKAHKYLERPVHKLVLLMECGSDKD